MKETNFSSRLQKKNKKISNSVPDSQATEIVNRNPRLQQSDVFHCLYLLMVKR